MVGRKRNPTVDTGRNPNDRTSIERERPAARVRRTPRFPSSAAFLVLRTLPPGPARSRRPTLRNSLLFSTIYAPTAAHLARLSLVPSSSLATICAPTASQQLILAVALTLAPAPRGVARN